MIMLKQILQGLEESRVEILVMLELFFSGVEFFVGEEVSDTIQPRLYSSESGRSNFRGNFRGREIFSSGVNYRYRVRGRGYAVEGRNAASNAINATATCRNIVQKPGHLARNCFLLKCFNCQELGHIAKDCKSPNSFLCSRCGGKNHSSKNCTATVEHMNEWKKDDFF